MFFEKKKVVVGSGGVGKSCLTIRYLKDQFTSEYDPTIEENYRKKINLGDGEILLEVVDTAGQVCFYFYFLIFKKTIEHSFFYSY